jgi:hypothetical protein
VKRPKQYKKNKPATTNSKQTEKHKQPAAQKQKKLGKVLRSFIAPPFFFFFLKQPTQPHPIDPPFFFFFSHENETQRFPSK